MALWTGNMSCSFKELLFLADLSASLPFQGNPSYTLLPGMAPECTRCA